jgi:hypothetical protein
MVTDRAEVELAQRCEVKSFSFLFRQMGHLQSALQ